MKRLASSSIGWWALALLAPALLLGGCRMAEEIRRPRMDANASIYDEATITYQLDASHLSEPMALARVEGQRVSYDSPAAPPVAGLAVGTLKIVYPHPDHIPGYAQAEVVIQSRAPKGSKGAQWPQVSLPSWKVADLKADEVDHEIWRYDLPKIELDRALGQLSEEGYFTRAESTAAGIEVDARVDSVHRKKTWRQVQHLDAIMMMVRRDGQLVSYRRPPTHSPKPQVAAVDSGDKYHDLAAREAAWMHGSLGTVEENAHANIPARGSDDSASSTSSSGGRHGRRGGGGSGMAPGMGGMGGGGGMGGMGGGMGSF